MTSLFRPFPGSLGLASGHVWTVSRFAARSRGVPWLVEPHYSSVEVTSDFGLPVHLRTAWHEVPAARSARRLLVLIHGLGGSAESGYMRSVTNAALAANVSTLRVNLRGADEHGWDFYHAGLKDDVLRVLEDPRVATFDSVGVFGISLGGHVTLRAAGDARLAKNVTAVVTLCPPLDLEAAVAAFDTKGQWLYRRHVLGGLKEMYRRFSLRVGHEASKRGLPDWRQANAIARIRDWDESIVAPRHGFASALSYYHSERASTRLHEVTVPSLVVTTRWDPMVPHATTETALIGTPLSEHSLGTASSGDAEPWRRTRVLPNLVHWELPSGGHVAWPEPRPPKRSVIHHMLEWLGAPTGLA